MISFLTDSWFISFSIDSWFISSSFKSILLLDLIDSSILSAISILSFKNDFAFSTDSFTNNAIDPVGAGDALLAYSTLSLIASKSLTISSIIGSIAAACECEKDGNIPITSQEVIARIGQIQKNTKYIIE